MTPRELDSQSPVKISRWIEVHSQECIDIDDGLHAFTLECIEALSERGKMFIDSMGRIWARWDENGLYHPFHTNHGKELVGYRLSSKAAN